MTNANQQCSAVLASMKAVFTQIYWSDVRNTRYVFGEYKEDV
jgi:hypothetical protein